VKCVAYLINAEIARFGIPFKGQKVWYDFENLDNFDAKDCQITIHSIEGRVMWEFGWGDLQRGTQRNVVNPGILWYTSIQSRVFSILGKGGIPIQNAVNRCKQKSWEKVYWYTACLLPGVVLRPAKRDVCKVFIFLVYHGIPVYFKGFAKGNCKFLVNHSVYRTILEYTTEIPAARPSTQVHHCTPRVFIPSSSLGSSLNPSSNTSFPSKSKIRVCNSIPRVQMDPLNRNSSSVTSSILSRIDELTISITPLFPVVYGRGLLPITLPQDGAESQSWLYG